MQKQKLTAAGFLITLTGAILFSTKAIIVKIAFANTTVDALALLTLRMIFSLPFYLVAAWLISSKAGNVRLNMKQWLMVIILGVLGYYLSSLFDFLGLQYISAGLERLILFLYPTFAVLLNRMIFKQKLNRNQKLALLLTYAGIGVAFFGELKIDPANDQFIWGSFLIFLCAVTYSFYLVGSGRLIPYTGAFKFTAYSMLVATAGILIHFTLVSDFEQLLNSTGIWWYGLLLAVVATVIPSFFLASGIKKIGSNNVAIISSIGPVSTILQAHFILGEKMFIEQVIGTVLVIIGVILLGWNPKLSSQT